MKEPFGFIIFLRLKIMDWQDNEQGDNEEFVPSPYPQLDLSFKDKNVYQCSTLFIASYGASSLFAHSLIGNSKPTNRLNFSRGKQQSLADLYYVNQSLFLIFNDHLQPMKEIYLSKFIGQHFTFQKIIVLVAVSKTTLKEASNSHLAYISSTAFSEKLVIPRFKQGIMGLAADIIQWGEINKYSVCCFVGIFGEYELSSQIIEQVFGSLRGKHGMTGNADISENVKRYNMKKYSNKIYL